MGGEIGVDTAVAYVLLNFPFFRLFEIFPVIKL